MVILTEYLKNTAKLLAVSLRAMGDRDLEPLSQFTIGLFACSSLAELVFAICSPARLTKNGQLNYCINQVAMRWEYQIVRVILTQDFSAQILFRIICFVLFVVVVVVVVVCCLHLFFFCIMS